jgi:hypothetical protein
MMRYGSKRLAVAAFIILRAACGASAQTAGPSAASGVFGFANEFSGIGMSLCNAGWFCLPVLAWNIALTPKLDMGSFPGAIPAWYDVCENVLRAAALGYPFARPIDPHAPLFLPGLCVYGIGALVYFASWFPLMDSSPRPWQKSILAQLAPAYTPILWLAGIALMANSPAELCLSALFVSLHVGEYLMRWKPD